MEVMVLSYEVEMAVVMASCDEEVTYCEKAFYV